MSDSEPKNAMFEVRCTECGEHFDAYLPADLEDGDLYMAECHECGEDVDVVIVDKAE